MAQKRISMVRPDLPSESIWLVYNDGTRGELDMTKARTPLSQIDTLVGLTLKQAKMLLGIKN